jgi:hypothetical protein
LKVQLDQALNAFECLVGQAEQGFNIRLVGGNHLFNGHHLVLRWVFRGFVGCMLHRNISGSIGT